MNILIFGGTGFIASHLVPLLTDHNVYIFHNRSFFHRFDCVHYIQGDRNQLVDHLDYLASLNLTLVIDMNAQNANQAELIVQLLNIIPSRLIAFSSISVYQTFSTFLGIHSATINNIPNHETSPLRSHLFPYSKVKLRSSPDQSRYLINYDKIPVENIYQQCIPELTTIIRVPFTYGPGDTQQRLHFYVQRMLDNRPFIFLHKNVKYWINAKAFVVNLAKFILQNISSVSPPTVYNYCDPIQLTEFEWINAIGAEMSWNGSIYLTEDPMNGISLPPIDEFPLSANYKQNLLMDSSRSLALMNSKKIINLTTSLSITIEDLLRNLSAHQKPIYTIENNYIADKKI